MEKLKLLEEKYSRLPKEIKILKRWVCFNKKDKIPMNALTGNKASCDNPLSWTNFDTAISGCVKYNFDGIGFMLGNGITGVDLDNHGDIPPNEFKELSNEFISSLNSYTERSQSGNGIHIICKGTLPSGGNRKGNIEMYDGKRYFAMTGDVVNDMPIEDREKELKFLWEKYININNTPVRTKTTKKEDGSVVFGNIFEEENVFETTLIIGDSELIDRIKASKNGYDFMRLYNQGDLKENNGDHSSADLSLCTILAFWTGCNKNQMDRIFRTSALMREKWDEYRGKETYGNITINKAISSTIDTYTPPKEKVIINTVQANNIVMANNECESNIDDNGDPIIKKVNKTFKVYSLDDTGNAEHYYDLFGHLFRYNCDNKCYMFWNNKTWVSDIDGFSKKYADELIKILKAEVKEYHKNIETLPKEESDEEEIKRMKNIEKEMHQNITRISNKAGKDAMLTELQHLHNMPVRNSNFDTQEMLLNTASGVVNLETGEIMPFDQKLMLSMNTNCKVSYEEPKTWIKFLHDVFERGNSEETEEIIAFVQEMLYYSLTGRTNKDKLVILWGEGSNGKSTFMECVKTIFGQYGKTMNSSLLIQNPNGSSQATEFALSSLLGARLVATSETAEGKKLDEVTIKQMTSGEEITAQQKYGAQFSFKPSFTPWMSTNNKPVIRATDFGTWRRMCLIPFVNTFTEEKKDINMPRKLAAEMPQILGWIIQGKDLYNKHKGDPKPPKCIEEALANYKNEMNVLSAYLSQRTQDFPGYRTQASVLFKDYKNWCLDNAEYLLSETKFGREMGKRSYEKIKTRNGVYYVGIKLNTDHKGHIFGEEEGDD